LHIGRCKDSSIWFVRVLCVLCVCVYCVCVCVCACACVCVCVCVALNWEIPAGVHASSIGFTHDQGGRNFFWKFYHCQLFNNSPSATQSTVCKIFRPFINLPIRVRLQLLLLFTSVHIIEAFTTVVLNLLTACVLNRFCRRFGTANWFVILVFAVWPKNTRKLKELGSLA
jgi:hypothetical protein